MTYGALFNATYKPNPLEAIYLKDPPRYLGPFFVTGLVASFMFAVIVTQVQRYFATYKSDTRLQKFHVGLMLTMVVLKSAQIVAGLWKRDAGDWGNFYELTQIEGASKLASTTTALVTTVVQVFFIDRCFRLSNRNYFFAVPAVAGMLLNLGSALWMTAIMPTNFSKKSPMFNIASKLFPISSVVTDSIITATTLYTLISVRHKASSARTSNIIQRLLRLTLETAFPPLITAALNATFTGQLNGPYVFLFLSTTPYLQAFSMMYTINLRNVIREGTCNGTGSVEVSGMLSISKSAAIKLNSAGVNVSRTIDTDPLATLAMEEGRSFSKHSGKERLSGDYVMGR